MWEMWSDQQTLALEEEEHETPKLQFPQKHCDREILTKYHVLLLITGKKKLSAF